MEMRGAESLLSPTVTSAMLGCFQKDQRTRFYESQRRIPKQLLKPSPRNRS
jgi:GTP cyclohydrolase I